MRQAGEVVFASIFEERSGRSKGAAVVEYKTPEDAAAAIEQLNDSTLGERMIFVREDRESGRTKGSKGGYGGKGSYGSGGKGKGYDNYSKGSYGKGGYGKGGYGGSQPLRVGPRDKGRLVYVGNLPFRCAWQDVKDQFKEYGDVIHVDIAQDVDGRSKGYATVLFEKEDDAQSAIENLNETEFQGRNLMVRLDNFL